MKISVSILKSLQEKKETIEKLNLTTADYIHIDAMDGIFVEGKNFNVETTNELIKYAYKPIDVHLMVENPKEYILKLNKEIVHTITIHQEIKEDKLELIDLIHENNINAGIAINPETSIKDIAYLLDKVDRILILGVNPGKGGQKLLLSTTEKIDELKYIRDKNNLNFEISFDGGINSSTIQLFQDVDVIVAGSFICMSESMQDSLNALKKEN